MIRAEPVTLEDVARWPAFGAARWLDDFPHMRAAIAVQAQTWPSIKLMAGDEPLCLAGMVFGVPGTGECWMLGAPALAAHAVGVVRRLRAYVLRLETLAQLHRVSMHVASDYAAGLRFAEALGFSFEARLRRAGPYGEDWTVMVRNVPLGGALADERHRQCDFRRSAEARYVPAA